MGLDIALHREQDATDFTDPRYLIAVASSIDRGGPAETLTSFAAGNPSRMPARDSTYRPGVCNIGPVEIARRHRAGHVGLLATIAPLWVLVALGVPPIARLVVALPAAAAAAGYLQARLHFCAGFGSRGVFNFGPLGETQKVADHNAHAQDRSKATQIGLASLAIGVAVGVAAVLLPT